MDVLPGRENGKSCDRNETGTPGNIDCSDSMRLGNTRKLENFNYVIRLWRSQVGRSMATQLSAGRKQVESGGGFIHQGWEIYFA